MGNNSSKEEKHRSKSLKKSKNSSDSRRTVSGGSSTSVPSKASSSGPATNGAHNNQLKPQQQTQQQADSRPAYSRSDTLGSVKSSRSFNSRLSGGNESFVSANSDSANNATLNQQAYHTSIPSNPPSNLNSNSNDLANSKQSQEKDLAFSVPLTPGPSILAAGPALSGGVSTQDSPDISGDRPRLHRRTYSSNSIINGGVVNLSSHNSSSSLAAQAAADPNDNSNTATSTSNINANSENSLANGIVQSAPGSDINAQDGTKPFDNIPTLNLPSSDVAQNAGVETDYFNVDMSIPNGSGHNTGQHNIESEGVTNDSMSQKPNPSLTIPIPSNDSNSLSSSHTNVSDPNSLAQTPNRASSLSEVSHQSPNDINKSTSSPTLKTNKSSDGYPTNPPLTPNGTSGSFSNGISNSPSQFVTPLSSPLPRDIPVSESRRKINLRTPSFGGSSAGNQSNGITLNIDEAIQRLLDAGYRGRTTKHVCLKNNEIALICQTARDIFLSQPVVLDLSPPVKVVGDVHGQYGDLIRLFDMCGFPPASNYLFLGDYVDRGKQSLETILLLLCYKIKYPENFFLLRGNHECASVTRVYGFYDECKRRTNIKTWKIFIDTFNTLPVAAIIAQKIFCVHGGLSPSLNNMNQLRSIQRPTDVPDVGLLNDILWSDPADTENEWEDNERGVSFCFNKVAINKFLAKFGFDLVCRAHIVVEDGYEFFNERTLVTVFSAPNYCGEFDNWGAVMSVSDDLLCSFELLKPLDSMALRQEMQKSRRERKHNALAVLQNSVGAQSY